MPEESFEIVPIPTGFDTEERKKWNIQVLVEGEMKEADYVKITSPYINVSCGLRMQDGFIGAGWDEKTDFVVLLESEAEGKTVLGLVYKKRNNLNLVDEEPCMMGGLVKSGETCCDTLKRKVCDLAVKKAKPLADEPYILNRLYQIRREGREGVRFLTMHIPSDWLESAETKNGIINFKTKEGYGIGPDTANIRFFFIPDAMTVTKDVLVPAAVGLLMTKMLREGKEIKI